jgi:hypothetical protein
LPWVVVEWRSAWPCTGLRARAAGSGRCSCASQAEPAQSMGSLGHLSCGSPTEGHIPGPSGRCASLLLEPSRVAARTMRDSALSAPPGGIRVVDPAGVVAEEPAGGGGVAAAVSARSVHLGFRAGVGAVPRLRRLESAQQRWRMVNAPHLVALVRAGALFVNGKLVERPNQDQQGDDQQAA